MKKFVPQISALLFSFVLSAQVQNNAPWNNSNVQKRSKTTLNSTSKEANNFFQALDINKKGSGFKPFKRWENHWKYYLNNDNTISSSQQLWNAWQQKTQMPNITNAARASNTQSTANWFPLGPFSSSNTHNTNNFKQTGQGRINTIIVDPNNVNTYYVGTPAGGIWKSTNKGYDWIPLTDHLPQIGVSGIAINPNNSNEIYIATGDDDAGNTYAIGVWKSLDGGTTWENTTDLPGAPTSMNEIYINPNQTNTILVATNKGVFKSTNSGNSWYNTLDDKIMDLKAHPNNSNIWYAASKKRVYKSTNGGESFAKVIELDNSSRIALDITIANESYVYFVSADKHNNFNGIYKSTNAGDSFSKTAENSDIFKNKQAWYNLAITVSQTNPEEVYVGTLDIWKSIDGGDNFTQLNRWQHVNAANYTHADIHFMRFFNNKLYVGSDGGIYESEDHGNTFVDLTKKLAISQFYKISVSQDNTTNIAGGIQDNGGFSFTNDQWYNYHGGDGTEGAIDPTNTNKHYGFSQYGAQLSISNDGGQTRSKVITAPSTEINIGDMGGEWVTPLAITNSGEVYAGYSQLYKLENDNWTKISNHDFGGDIDIIKFNNNDQNIIYVTQFKRLFISKDKGETFTHIPFNKGTIYSIEINNNIMWIVTSRGVYKSENINSSSPNFSNITKNLPSETKTVIKRSTSSTNNSIYLGSNLGVYYINDNMNEWIAFDNGLPNVQVRDLEINETTGTLYAATYGRGVFFTELSTQNITTDIEISSVSNIETVHEEVTPEIKITNHGTEIITEFQIVYNIENETEDEKVIWRGTLNPNETNTISLPEISLNEGEYNLLIEAVLEGDETPENNKLNIPIQKIDKEEEFISEFKEYTIYPNPSTGIFQIHGYTKKTTVVVTDTSSKMIINHQNVSDNPVINLANLSNGIYLLNIYENGGIQRVKKLIVQ